MAIVSVHDGSVTAPENNRDIIVGISTRLPRFIFGRPVLIGESITRERKLGEVISFRFDDQRCLHAIVCRRPGAGGWEKADEHVRVALDCLPRRGWVATRSLSIVYIGNSPTGRRQGADATAIYLAMAKSFSPLHIFWEGEAQVRMRARDRDGPILKPFLLWHSSTGERNIHVAM